MLAVLPLENLSADPEQEYFVDGMTDELISHLGRVQPKRLGVIARTSALRYKKTGKSIEEIGRELGVEFVLEGSVRRAGDRIRITTQLIQVSDQSNLWAQTHDRRLADIFELQDEVATTVAKALEMELVTSREDLSPDPATARGLASGPDVTKSAAYDAYLKGRFHWNKRTPEGIRQGIEWFERAIKADPQFARAYSGLSDVYNITITYMLLPAEEAIVKSERAARRALELDPKLADGHTSLASVLTHKGEPEEARHGFRRALDLDPNYVPALYWGAMNLVTLGDFEGAMTTIARAEALDPLSVTIKIVQGNIHFYARRYEDALPYFREVVELEPKLNWPRQRVPICLAALGLLEEALADVDRHPPELARSLDVVSARAYVLGRLGRLDESRAALKQLEERSKSEHVSWERFAYAYLGLDDRTSLLKLLEGIKIPGVLGRLSLRHESAFDIVRDDPRFQRVLRV
jgi:TolB-like protein/tetratricopeptide (TPR) repeat protein